MRLLERLSVKYEEVYAIALLQQPYSCENWALSTKIRAAALPGAIPYTLYQLRSSSVQQRLQTEKDKERN